ncbi:paraneoplastic antigen-like protein 8B, partial [Enhydra lutris kenyoni]|uniref:Paraneoplastic antigen-like protein 8B n=1 Tax=Enhydra lutris kenyoni TaxID=391180 RepID=A0A2Y9IMA1_ENHLU
RGRRARRNRARGNRWVPRGQSTERREQPPTSARWESDASSEGSLGIVLEELDQDDLSADEAQSALSATLHQAARELSTKEWALQGRANTGEGPRELLALVTVTDEAKQEPTEKEASEPQAVSLDGSGGSGEGRSRVPDLVALLAVRDAGDEEPVYRDAPQGESQPNGAPGDEALEHPEFVAIVASTDPSDPSAREELLKIASVIASLGWSPRTDPTDALGEVLSVLCQDTGGARVQVQQAGRRVDGLVLRKATGGGSLRECVCALAAPDPQSPGRRAPRGLLAGWDDGEGGLLELVALLAARDTAGVTPEAGDSGREGGRGGRAGGQLGEVLALPAAGEGAAAEAAAEAAESRESGPERRASGKARTKRARTASGTLGEMAAAPGPSGSRRRRGAGGGRGGRAVTPETRAWDPAAAQGKKKGRAGAGAQVQAGEARAQPPPGSESARGRKARSGWRQPPKRR